MVREPVQCAQCNEGASLTRGAVIRLPGVNRWVHRACLDADPALAQATERRVQRALTFQARRGLHRLPPVNSRA